MHNPLWKWNLNSFLGITTMKTFNELVSNQVTVYKLLHTQYNSKIDAGITERMVSYKRFKCRHATWNISQHLFRYLNSYLLYFFKVAIVRNAYLNQCCHFLFGLIIIGYHALRHLLVRNHNNSVRECSNLCGAPTDS